MEWNELMASSDHKIYHLTSACVFVPSTSWHMKKNTWKFKDGDGVEMEEGIEGTNGVGKIKLI